MLFRKLFLNAAVLLCTTTVAFSGKYEAVVIGNVSYPAAPLANAARDAETVARALAEAGFSVTTFFDVDQDQVSGMLETIRSKIADAEIGVIYYAGHAFQYDGQNQLLAIGVDELTEAQIDENRIPLNELMNAAAAGTSEDAYKKLRVVIVDACRNDPFSELDDKFTRGISYEEGAGSQTLVAYSTSAGKLAFDGPRGGNGPYALAFARALGRKDATISSALRSIRRDVRVATDGLQIPWVVGSIENDPVFGVAQSTAKQIQSLSSDGPTVAEILWYFLRNDLTIDGLAEFVSIFPESPFTSDATRRISEIQKVANVDTTRSIVLATSEVTAETLQGLARATEVSQVASGFDIDSTIPSELFNIWPDTLPQTADGLETMVTKCDILASDPADPQRIAPPTRDGLVNLRNAARACAAALKDQPDNPRFLFQFGRILDIAGRYDWAKSFYNRAAYKDYSAAMTNLGYMAIRGRGGDRDYDAAAKFYTQAAVLGNLRARTNIGSMFIRGQGREVQADEGILWYRLASGMGWANAQNALGDLYRKGVGLERDPQAALSLYTLAASNGQREAMNSLGRSYANGWGVDVDRVRSHEWFERAIAAGDRYAPRFFAQDLMQNSEGSVDPNRIIELMALSAERGFLDGYRELASLYYKGALVPKNIELAYRNVRLAELGKVKKVEDLATKIRAELGADVAKRIDAEISNQRRLNGL